MAIASWNGTVLAQSDDIVVVEGNLYFPLESINQAYFTSSDKTSVCPWKGTANYYDLNVDGDTNLAAAWYYTDSKEAARNIQGRVAFWNGVKVES